MKQILASLCLAAFVTVSFAQSPDHFGRLTVGDPNNCPANSTAMAYYKFENGMFIRMGWICEQNIHSPG